MAEGASAPGKLMIAGEYAVLEGAPALVAAVGARARGLWSDPSCDGSTGESADSPEKPSIPREAVVARAQAEEACAPVPRDLHIDVHPLRRSGRKLGLGSSAAAAAAAAGAVFAWAGQDLRRAEVRQRVLKAALEGHHAIAPEGSGADVAASVLGGFVRFRRPELASTEVEARPAGRPEGLELRVVWTGAEARTSELVRKVRELQQREPARFDAVMGALAEQSGRFVDSWERGDARAVVAAAGAYGEAMAALGEAAGAPIVEWHLRRVIDLAGRAGGSAKPSGAGGGDVAIAFFASEDDAAAFERLCREQDLTLLDLQMGADGVLPLEA